MFSTSPVHILKAINNEHLLTWPGLDANIVSKNLPTHVIATVKGHMKRDIQHLQSTKIQPPPQKIRTAQEEK